MLARSREIACVIDEIRKMSNKPKISLSGSRLRPTGLVIRSSQASNKPKLPPYRRKEPDPIDVHLIVEGKSTPLAAHHIVGVIVPVPICVPVLGPKRAHDGMHYSQPFIDRAVSCAEIIESCVQKGRTLIVVIN